MSVKQLRSTSILFRYFWFRGHKYKKKNNLKLEFSFEFFLIVCFCDFLVLLILVWFGLLLHLVLARSRLHLHLHLHPVLAQAQPRPAGPVLQRIFLTVKTVGRDHCTAWWTRRVGASPKYRTNHSGDWEDCNDSKLPPVAHVVISKRSFGVKKNKG